jgi:flagellum-specific ATP synthase
MQRGAVNQPLSVGFRAVDGMLTLARGMRMGVFAAAGVGKSTFVGAALRNAKSAINVVALVGERGREVSEFVEHILGEEGMTRSVLVVATSDRSPLERVRAAFTATAIAEHFRDEGHDVLLVVDSLTRLGMAQREIGLAIGEPATTKGYTPSVFALLPKLLERVCPAPNGGSITGLYTVLVEGDDINDPLADSARSLLDGHIVLSRELASKGHYPAIDVAASVSRVMEATVSREHSRAANELRAVMALAKEAQDLINFGAYTPGKNARFDRALERMNEINQFLRQSPRDISGLNDTVVTLQRLAAVRS